MTRLGDNCERQGGQDAGTTSLQAKDSRRRRWGWEMARSSWLHLCFLAGWFSFERALMSGTSGARPQIQSMASLLINLKQVQ